jgi:hypothetical protein
LALAFLYSLPRGCVAARCRCADECQGPLRSFLVINSVMFRCPPTLLIHVGDNLVSDGHGSLPTMNSDTGIETREQILLAEILWRCDSILLKLSMCFGCSEATGGGARCAIGDHGGTGILGAVTGDVLIASDDGARDVDNNILAKGGGGGDLLGSIDDSAVQLAVAGNSNNSAARRVPTSTCTAAARRSRIRIGPGRQ